MMENLRISLWRAWLRLSGPVPDHLATLERLRGGHGAWQEERLAALLAFAAERVPFYRARLAGVVADGRVRLELDRKSVV